MHILEASRAACSGIHTPTARQQARQRANLASATHAPPGYDGACRKQHGLLHVQSQNNHPPFRNLQAMHCCRPGASSLDMQSDTEQGH